MILCELVLAPLPSFVGVNPRGLTPDELWQSDVTRIMEFGHVSVDLFSHFVVATAHTGEKACDVIRHWLQCIAVVGVPKTIKTDNEPAYVSAKVQVFFFLQI